MVTEYVGSGLVDAKFLIVTVWLVANRVVKPESLYKLTVKVLSLCRPAALTAVTTLNEPVPAAPRVLLPLVVPKSPEVEVPCVTFQYSVLFLAAKELATIVKPTVPPSFTDSGEAVNV